MEYNSLIQGFVELMRMWEKRITVDSDRKIVRDVIILLEKLLNKKEN